MRKCILVIAFAIASIMATPSFADPSNHVDFQYHRAEKGSMFTTYTYDYGTYQDDDNTTSFNVYLDEDFPKDDIDSIKTVIRSYDAPFDP